MFHSHNKTDRWNIAPYGIVDLCSVILSNVMFLFFQPNKLIQTNQYLVLINCCSEFVLFNQIWIQTLLKIKIFFLFSIEIYYSFITKYLLIII